VKIAPADARLFVQAQYRPDEPVPPATVGERPKVPGDATPRQTVIPEERASPVRGDPATTLPHVITALRQQFGAQFDRLPPAELASFARACNEFTRGGSDRRTSPRSCKPSGAPSSPTAAAWSPR
jgi:hypothetical protein